MNETTKTRRGKLDFKLSTSSTQIEAGKEFSVSIAITNPFDIPIKIKKVATKLPIEFIDVTRERLKKQELLLEDKLKDLIKVEIPTLTINKENKNRLIRDLSKEIFRAIPMVGSLFAVGSTVAEYILASNISTTASIEKLTDSISSSDVKKIVAEAKTVPNPEKAIKDNLIKLLESKVDDIKKVSISEVLLHPGNATIHVFTIKTSKSVLFSPFTYKLHMEIEYEADSLDQRDIIEYSLSISTSIRSMMFGAGMGSALGFIVNDIFNEKTIATAMTSASFETAIPAILILLANIALGVISVIIFSRKKDVQAILAIEDFWGGVLIGFMVGYTGKGFIEKLLPTG